jgi:hypothetical protein
MVQTSKLYVQAHFNGSLHSEKETSAVQRCPLVRASRPELGREPVGSPSDKPIHTPYALIRDFQAIPGAGRIFVGGDERLYRAGFAPGFSRI